jgi:hypothetical protein
LKIVKCRKFIYSAGALATLGSIGTVSGAVETDEPSTTEFGEAFHEGMMEGGADGARDALLDLGVNPVVESTQDFEVGPSDPSAPSTSSESDFGVSPEYSY